MAMGETLIQYTTLGLKQGVSKRNSAPNKPEERERVIIMSEIKICNFKKEGQNWKIVENALRQLNGCFVTKENELFSHKSVFQSNIQDFIKP